MQVKDLNKVSLTEVEQKGIEKLFKDFKPDLSIFAKDVYLGIVTAFKPTSGWFQGWTDKVTGDKSNARIAGIENQLKGGAASSPNVAVLPLHSMQGLSLGGALLPGRGTNNLQSSTNAELVTRLSDRE